MVGLCGWVGPFDEADAAETTLQKMAAALVPTRRAAGDGRVDPAAALCVEGDAGEAFFHAAPDLWAAIVGQPRWTTEALRSTAAAEGHAAALANAYRVSGAGLFEHLEGPFTVAVYDRGRNRLLAAVDRFGVHTLYFATDPAGRFVFGSTADAVRAHPGVGATLSGQSIFHFFYFGVVPSPETIYREQRKLLPAECLVFDGASVATDFYWHIPYGAPIPDGAGDGEHLLRVMREATRRSLGDGPADEAGAFLSGGLDSSTVAGMLAELTAEPARTFTIGFAEETFDEMAYAKCASEHFGTAQYEYYLTPGDVTELWPRAAAAFDEPFGNSSALPAYFCARMAKEKGVRVLLGGDGGDEIFAGNMRYVKHKGFEPYGRLPAALRRGLLEPLLAGRGDWMRIGPLGKAIRYVEQASVPLPDRFETPLLFQTHGPGEVFGADVLDGIDPEGPLKSLREPYFRTTHADAVYRMLHLDMKLTLADNDLRKVTRMCDLAEMPVRYPILDEAVVRFAAGVPAESLIKGYQIRHFYKKALEGYLPEMILTKKKHGFGMPYAEWPKTDPVLRQLVGDCLAGFRRRGILRADFMDRLQASNAGPIAHIAQEMTWDIVTFELWLRGNGLTS